jgi:hypothetical protein
MIIMVATVYVYGSANYSRLEAYYAKYMNDYVDDEAAYLEGINTLMNIDYHQETPAYTYIATSETHTFTLSIYAIGVTLDDQLYDGMMIFVNDIDITEAGTPVENPKLKIEVTLSDDTYLSGEEKVNTATVLHDPDKPFPYSYVPALFLLYADNYLLIPEEEGSTEEPSYATIEQITLAYSNGETDEDGALVYNDTLLFIGADMELADAAYNKLSDMSIDNTTLQLSANFSGDHPSEAEMITFGLNATRGDLGEFNLVIVRTMAIYVLIVLALTYVLFFHKMVMDKVRSKRLDTTNSSKPKVEEAIFKDIEYPKEDGK